MSKDFKRFGESKKSVVNFDKKNQKKRRSNHEEQLPEDFFRVDGFSAIREFLLNKPEVIREIYSNKRDFSRIEALVESVGSRFSKKEFAKIRTPKPNLESETKEDNDLETSRIIVQLQTVGWKSFLERIKKAAPSMIVICDHITDPRNLGAIIRNCAFFGVPYVIVPERRQALMSHACVSTSQGGLAWVDLVNAPNIARCCEELKELNFWLVGTEVNGQEIKAFQRPKQSTLALVLGNENEGISRLVMEKCDEMVSVAGAGKRIESLNVSVACGIALHEFFHSKL